MRDLDQAGVEKIFQEQVSSVDANRPELAKAFEFVREGDVFLVTKLDRLARSVANFIEIAKHLESKNVDLRILDLGMDTTTPTGKLTLNILASIAQFEREMMLTRQREGIAKARAAGKFKGRAPTARAKAPEVHRLRAEGVGATEIAKLLGIGRKSVYRIIGTNGELSSA